MAASPFVAAFTEMGIPYADHIMNAVVLTAVLSCLNSGMYTASRMLFVLAARREAPAALVGSPGAACPPTAILASSVVGFLCVIAAAISPDTIFAFLLNSCGAIILFVYLLIADLADHAALPHAGSELRVKMWLFPVLSILTVAAMVAVLVQMDLQDGHPVAAAAEPGVLGGGAGVVLRQQVVHESPPVRRASSRRRSRTGCWCWPTRQSDPRSCSMSFAASTPTAAATYFVVVPASPIETGAAATHGPLDVREATQQAAQERLDNTLAILRSENLDADGALGDYRPLRALAEAVDSFDPDQIVIATLPPEFSVWHRFDVVDRARAQHGVPVTHVVASSAMAGRA